MPSLFLISFWFLGISAYGIMQFTYWYLSIVVFWIGHQVRGVALWALPLGSVCDHVFVKYLVDRKQGDNFELWVVQICFDTQTIRLQRDKIIDQCSHNYVINCSNKVLFLTEQTNDLPASFSIFCNTSVQRSFNIGANGRLLGKEVYAELIIQLLGCLFNKFELHFHIID